MASVIKFEFKFYEIEFLLTNHFGSLKKNLERSQRLDQDKFGTRQSSFWEGLKNKKVE